MRALYITLFCCSVTFAACNSNGEQKTETNRTSESAKPTAAPESKLNAEGTQKMVALVADYYELKNAFVATDAAKADLAAGRMTASATTMTAYLKSDTASGAALKPYLDTIDIQLKSLLAIKDDKNCEKKRVPFSLISNNIYSLVKKANLKNDGIYQQYCPMAFDSKGAYWLSNEAEIKNPYYGKKMLECGDVTDSLK